MLDVKQKIHLKKQKIALDKTIKKLLGDLVKSESYFKDDFLNIHIDNEYLLQEELNLILPSLEDISETAKKLYKDFDNKKAMKVNYYFNKIYVMSKKLVITAKGSNLNFFGCYFNDIKITDADKILIHNNIFSKQIVQKMEFTSKEKIIINFVDFIEAEEGISFNSNEIDCYLSCFKSSLGDINLTANEIKLIDCGLKSHKININTDRFLTKEVGLIANDEINITNKNCDEIKGVYAPKIIYNGVDITNTDSIIKPKITKKLIEVLQKIKNNFEGEINLRTKEYNKELNDTPVKSLRKNK